MLHDEDPEIRAAREKIGRALTEFPWRRGSNASRAASVALGLIRVVQSDLDESPEPMKPPDLKELLGDFYVPDEEPGA